MDPSAAEGSPPGPCPLSYAEIPTVSAAVSAECGALDVAMLDTQTSPVGCGLRHLPSPLPREEGSEAWEISDEWMDDFVASLDEVSPRLRCGGDEVSSVDPGAPGPSFSTPTRAPSHVRHGISPSDAAPDAGRLRSRAPRVPGHDPKKVTALPVPAPTPHYKAAAMQSNSPSAPATAGVPGVTCWDGGGVGGLVAVAGEAAAVDVVVNPDCEELDVSGNRLKKKPF